MAQFHLPQQSLDDEQALFFAVTLFSGEADIYVSYNHYPTVGNEENGDVYKFIWSSNATVDDSIIITTDDPNYNPEKEYYIGIYGNSHATFNLVAYTSNTTITLNDGVALHAVTLNLQYAYSEYQIDKNSTPAISASPLNGDPDMCVSTEVSFPNNDDFPWKSANFGFDLLEIGPNDPNYKPNGKYYIGIRGYGSENSFSILASTTETRNKIPDGIPISGEIKSEEYIYYDFHLFNPPETTSPRGVFIELTGFGSGNENLDMYVSVGDNNKSPTKSNYTWSSSDSSKKIINIDSSDPNFESNGQYHIGVYGAFKATYSILVYSGGDHVVLEPGVSITESLGQDTYAYFKFKHTDTTAGIVFQTFADTGQVSTYVSESVVKPKKEDQRHDFESHTDDKEEAIIHIPPEHNEEQWYWLSVYGEESSNHFIITASTNHSAQVLEEGVTVYYTEVSENDYRYFAFYLDHHHEQDVTVVVNSVRGDTNLFISNTQQRPNASNYVWKSSSESTNSVTIPANDPNWSKNDQALYIAVQGRNEAMFNILVFSSSNNTILYDNLPTPGSVVAGNYTYYELDPPQNVGQVTFYIDIKFQDNHMDADIYVSQSTKKPNKQAHHFGWTATSFDDESLRIDNAASEPFYIGIFGVTDSSFTITASFESIELLSSESLFDFVPQGYHRNYHFRVRPQSNAILATVTLIDGITELYINTNETQPSRNQSAIKDARFPGNTILSTIRDDIFSIGEWSMSVYGVQDSAYYISYMESEAMLSGGIPRLGETSYLYHPLYLYEIGDDDDARTRYSNYNNHVNKDYFLYVDVMSGEVDVYVNQDEEIPGPRTFVWQSTGSGDHKINLPRDQLKPGTLQISIRHSNSTKSDSSSFTISISTQEEPLFLTSAVPQQNMIHPSESSYFSVLTPNWQQSGTHSAKELQVIVESCSLHLSPHFYIGGPENKHPSQSDHMAASEDHNSPFAQYASIDGTSSQTKYHIGVDGVSSGTTTFSIFAHTDRNQRPQVNGDLSGSYDKNTHHLELSLQDASHTNYPHIYRGYAMIFSKDDYNNNNSNNRGINFDTYCAVEQLGVLKGTRHVTLEDEEANSNLKMKLTDLSQDKIYVINVIVESGSSINNNNNNAAPEGLKEAYSKIWLVHGQVQDEPPSSSSSANSDSLADSSSSSQHHSGPSGGNPGLPIWAIVLLSLMGVMILTGAVTLMIWGVVRYYRGNLPGSLGEPINYDRFHDDHDL